MSTTEAFILPFKCIDMSVPGKAKDQKKKKKKNRGWYVKTSKKRNYPRFFGISHNPTTFTINEQSMKTGP